MEQQTRTLPARPSLEQLRNQAKELRKSDGHPALSHAQHALAQSYGFTSWPKLKAAVDLRTLKNLIQDGEPGPVRLFLIDHRELVNATFEEGDTPLLCAAEENRPALVELLIEKGADRKKGYEGSGHSALSWALTCWSMEAAQKLVELGEVPDLFCSAGLGLVDELQKFWPGGQLVAHPSQMGSSRKGSDGQRLLCPPPNPRDQVSDALYIACRTGQTEAARFLLDHGADPDWRGYAGASCLAWADFSGKSDLIDLLEKGGASNEVRDQEFGVRPREFGLMVLAGWGFGWKLIERLKTDPDGVNRMTDFGTLLHAAAWNGHEWTVGALLQMGADRSKINREGKTARQLAVERGHGTVADLLA